VGGDLRWVEGTDNEEVFISSGANIRDRVIPGRQLYAGTYLNDVITPSPRWVISLGLRADHWRNYDASQTETETATGLATLTPFADTSRTRVTPRAGVLVHLNDNLALRGAAYGGFRAPSLNELYRPFRVGNVLTQANPNLGPERLWGGELGFNHSVAPNLIWRVTGFWDQLEDPIANVTLSVTPALITRQRQNLGGARIRGLSVDADYQPARRWRLQASYVLSDATVDESPTDPNLEGNLLPQVPRNRASLRLDYLNPEALNFSLRGQIESLRYDDDQNLLRLSGLLVVDLTVDRPIGRSWSAFVAIENLFDDRYPVQLTPVELQGTPFTVNAGVRLDLRPR
jgi:iron complex outermembrane recepter protein